MGATSRGRLLLAKRHDIPEPLQPADGTLSGPVSHAPPDSGSRPSGLIRGRMAGNWYDETEARVCKGHAHKGDPLRLLNPGGQTASVK